MHSLCPISRYRAALVGGALLLTAAALPAQDRVAKLVVTRRDYDMPRLATDAPADVVKGRVVWVQRCAYCHDGVGTPTYATLGPWLDADTVSREAAVRQKLRTGSARMPSFQYALEPSQVDALMVFLRSVKADQKPTPDQLQQKFQAAVGEP